jgi:hypothetical protein
MPVTRIRLRTAPLPRPGIERGGSRKRVPGRLREQRLLEKTPYSSVARMEIRVNLRLAFATRALSRALFRVAG